MFGEDFDFAYSIYRNGLFNELNSIEKELVTIMSECEKLELINRKTEIIEELDKM